MPELPAAFDPPAHVWDSDPFPHTVIDGAWSRDLLLTAASEFPPPTDPRWITYNDPQEYGKAAGPAPMWGPATRQWFEAARTEAFALWLTGLTGIEHLVADDLGGGMHQTKPGGRLASHIDFGVHPNTGLERRINLLVFLNEDWQDEWGGTIILGDPDVDAVRIAPTFNRTVIFETSNESWHGHPEPVVEGHLRKSLALYYYAPPRPETAARAGTTIWL